MGSLRPDGEEKDTHADPETCWRRLGHGCVKFNLPDGAEYAGPDEDGNDRFRVSIPLDEHGLFGRECPSCERTFLVSKESLATSAKSRLLLPISECRPADLPPPA